MMLVSTVSWGRVVAVALMKSHPGLDGGALPSCSPACRPRTRKGCAGTGHRSRRDTLAPGCEMESLTRRWFRGSLI